MPCNSCKVLKAHFVFLPRITESVNRGYDYAMNVQACMLVPRVSNQYFLADLAPLRRPPCNVNTIRGFHWQDPEGIAYSRVGPFCPWVVTSELAACSRKHVRIIKGNLFDMLSKQNLV